MTTLTWIGAAIVLALFVWLERWRIKHTPKCPTCGKEWY